MIEEVADVRRQRCPASWLDIATKALK